MMAITPVIMAVIFIIIFYFWKLIKKNSTNEYIRKVVVSIIMIIYTLHPTITRLSTSLFFCLELEPGEYWL